VHDDVCYLDDFVNVRQSHHQGFFFYVYISIKKNYNTNYNTYKINITILLERYPGEQATMTTPGPLKIQN